MDHIGGKAEIIYLRLELERLQREVDEQRARRLALERELAAMEDTWIKRKPEIRYVTRYVDRSPYVIKGPVKYIDRVVEKPERRLGPFGRAGDFLDRTFGYRE